MNEQYGHPFHGSFKPPAAECRTAHDPVYRQDRGSADQSAHNRIVGPDHRVLQDVAQDQQYDQVEDRHLRNFALSQQAKHHEQKEIDDERTGNFLAHWYFRQPPVHRYSLEYLVPEWLAGRRPEPFVAWGSRPDSARFADCEQSGRNSSEASPKLGTAYDIGLQRAIRDYPR
jgi:hypothetical protein